MNFQRIGGREIIGEPACLVVDTISNLMYLLIPRPRQDKFLIPSQSKATLPVLLAFFTLRHESYPSDRM